MKTISTNQLAREFGSNGSQIDLVLRRTGVEPKRTVVYEHQTRILWPAKPAREALAAWKTQRRLRKAAAITPATEVTPHRLTGLPLPAPTATEHEGETGVSNANLFALIQTLNKRVNDVLQLTGETNRTVQQMYSEWGGEVIEASAATDD